MKSLALFLLLPPIVLAQGGGCKIGELCTVRGVLKIFQTPPAATAVLQGEGTCIPLALSEDVLADYKRWTNKSVTVVGRAHAHGVADNVISYQLEGRPVTGSVCRASPIALFVTELKPE